MDEFAQFVQMLRSLGESVAAQLSSAWIYIQLGLLLLGALLALCFSAWLRKRVDFTALVMGWPAPLRLVLRAVFSNLALIIFVVLAGVSRRVMLVYPAPS